MWLTVSTALIAALVPATAHAASVVDQPVSFSVINENHSAGACTADGNRYVVNGSLVAPAAVLRQRSKPVVLLSHGAMLSGENLWRMRPDGDASFDFAQDLAKAGHAVVAVNLVGYGDSVSSDAPVGTAVCQGSEADVLHQVAEQLRSGSYTDEGATHTPAFSGVTLAGFSFGAQYAQLAAYSFPQDFSGLVLMGWAEPFLPTDAGEQLIGVFQGTCFGTPGRKYGTSGPPGYVTAPGSLVGAAQWAQPEPAAEQFWVSHTEGDPCGNVTSGGARAAADVAGLPSLAIPTLVIDGQQDGLVGWMGPHVLAERLTGVTDKTLTILPGAGHSFFLEPERAEWSQKISDWLSSRDL